MAGEISKLTENIKYLRWNSPIRTAPKYLLSTPDELLNHVIPQGLSEVLREVDRGNLNPFAVGKALIVHAVSGEGSKYIRDELIFQTVRDLADRRSNALTALISNPARESGRLIEQSREAPENSEHGAQHGRREEVHFEAAVGKESRLRHEESILPWLHSVHLAFLTHDLDQLTSLTRNREEGRRGTDRELIVKAGHGPAGSALALIFADLYGSVAKFEAGSENMTGLDQFMPADPEMQVSLAEFIAFGTAVMQLNHDEMDIYDQSLHATEKAYTLADNGEKIPLDDTTLYGLYKQQRLDKFSLSIADFIRLTRMEKRATGFEMTDSTSDIGLHPAIQKDYQGRIEQLLTDQRRPFDHFNESQRNQFICAAEMKVWTDDQDKNSPPNESVTRTTLTQYSQERPWTIDVPYEIMLAEIRNGRGRPDSPLNSDVMRILWEIYHQEDPLQNSTVKSNEYIQKLSRDTVIMRAIAIREFGIHIMQGDENYVNGLYQRRISKLQEKALGKAGFNRRNIAAFIGEANSLQQLDGNSIGYVAEKIRGVNPEIAARFEGIARNLINELRSVVNGFRCKPDKLGDPRKNLAENPAIKIYSGREIDNFIQTVNAVIADICGKKKVCTSEELDAWISSGYQNVPEPLARYEQLVVNGEFPPGTPFRTYDQLSEPNNRRMVFPLAELQVA